MGVLGLATVVTGLVTIAATTAVDAWLGVRTGVCKALTVTGIEVVTAIKAGGPRVPCLIGGEPEIWLGRGPYGLWVVAGSEGYFGSL